MARQSERDRMSVSADHARLSQHGVLLAGGVEDLAQRALVYLHLYRTSKGNHTFPLLAAHGALWASGHFKRGMWVSEICARAQLLQKEQRLKRLAEVSAFAIAMKDVNRRVCAETYTAFHMTRLHGEKSALVDFVPERLIGALNTCHAASRKGASLSATTKQKLFEAFFLWEQDMIVGPAVDAAVQAFTWPLVRSLVLRPPIGFSYFGPLTWLWFKSFNSRSERVQRGREAFSIAEQRGWDHVERSLARYPRMPKPYIEDAEECFEGLAKTYNVQIQT